jgi:hypothetical protein
LLVRLERADEATTFSVGGREVVRYRIVVIMDFTTEAGLQQLLSFLHDGAELVSTKQLRTYIHDSSTQRRCAGSLRSSPQRLQHCGRRRKGKLHKLSFLEVEYDCKHPASE